MRIAFMGTPAIAVPPLRMLAERHEVALCVTAPPRPRGRGQSVQPSEVGKAAEALGIEVLTPKKLTEDVVERILASGVEAAIVVAYGRMLPDTLFGRVPCLNLHPSLLPRHRGAAPIPWTIWSGDARWGITIMEIVKELDAGPIVLQESWPLGLETAGELLDLAAERGATMLLESLQRLTGGAYAPQPQAGNATYARMLTREDERLDFLKGAEPLARQVRALAPRPGVRVRFPGTGLELRLLGAEARTGAAEPGLLLDLGDAIGFGTSQGILAVGRVQPAGRGPQTAPDFLRGRPQLLGQVAE